MRAAERARMPDLRYALRQLARTPGYTAVAVLTLALGMGANTAFFSALYGVVLRQPDYPNAANLVVLHNTRGGQIAFGGMLSRGEVRDIRERQRSFAALAASDLGRMTLTSNDDADVFAERVKVSRVTPDLFTVLGVAPARGRGITAADRGSSVAVVSHAFWASHLGARADVVGRTVRLNGIDQTIIGIMPDGFSYPEPGMAAWLPLDLAPRDPSDNTDYYLTVVGRLAPGVTASTAREDLARVGRDLQRTIPSEFPANTSPGLDFESLRERQFGRLLLPLGVLMGTAAAVLLIACVNVAIMSLLRALERRREIAIRLALGAARGTIVKQLLAEAGVLCAIGAGTGLLFASLGLDLLKAFAPPDIPRLDGVTLDGTAFLFTGLILVLVTFVVGLAPAMVASRLRAFEGVVPTNNSSDGRAAARLRDALTVTEIALAASLVICAGLTLRSLHALTQVEMGFDGARVYSFKTNLTADAYPTPERVEAFYDALTSRLASLPGTRSIGAISYLPLSGEGLSLNAAPDNAPRNGTAEATVFWRLVRGRYFETMGVRVVAGRLFEATDRAGTPPVAVLDELVARRFWGSDAAAIGKRVRVGAGEPHTVVGVVRHVNEVGPGKPSFPIIYAPQAQAYQRGMYTVLRTTGTPASVLASARAALAAVDPAVPLYFAETVDARYDATLALPRFTAGLVSGFSLLALLLAGVGVFGVTAYAVRQRTREFGIRLALGAPLRHIVAIVLGRIGRLATIGLLLGGALAFGLGSLLSGLLFGVENTDVPSALVAVAAIAVMALAAAIVPLRHAAGVRPAEILRAE